MATSGLIRTNTSFGYVDLTWSESSQDIANNKTRIYYELRIYREYSISSSASKSYSVVFNGSTVASGTTTIGGSGTKVIKSGYVDIGHSGDGTKTFSYSFSQQVDINWGGSWVGTVTGSGSGTLDTIPRASTPTLSSTNFNMGSAITIYTNKLASFTHTVVVTFGGYTANIAFNVVDSVSWTPPTASMAPQIPNATAGIGSITVHTYSGSTLIGSKSVNFTANVPSSVVPTFTSVTAVEATTTPDVKTLAGAYVQNMSTLRLTANGPAGVYGSTINRHEFTFEGASLNAYTGPSVTTPVIKGSGTLPVTCTIYDTRGRTATKTINVTVLAYAPPKITGFSIDRANSTGTLNEMGTSVKITRVGTWSVIGTKNACTIVIKSKLRGTSTWTTKNTYAGGTGGSVNNSVVVSTYPATESHDFMIEYTDLFNTTISLAVISTGIVTMSWAPEGIGIGKVWEQGALDIGGSIYATGNASIGGKVYAEQFVGKLASTLVASGTDINDLMTEGMYYCPSSATTQTMPNRASNVAFSLLVERHAGCKQTWTDYTSNGWHMYVRNHYNGTWGEWYLVARGGKAPYTNVTLLNGWVNAYAEPAGYTITSEGICVVQARIKNGNTAGGTQVCSLPAPRHPVYYAGRGCNIYINTLGTAGFYPSNNSDVGFDGLVYRVAD